VVDGAAPRVVLNDELVQLVRPGDHAFRDGIAARNDQVIFGEIELLDREWHERQVGTMSRANERHVLKKTCVRPIESKIRTIRRLQHVE
jgi:hypothetical protein